MLKRRRPPSGIQNASEVRTQPHPDRDNPADIAFARRAFSRCRIDNPVYHCPDGDDALDYLYRRGRWADAASSPRPAVILLDLNMPGTDGRAVLTTIKGDPALCTTPVIVLTTSDDDRDVEACYRLGANSYMTKPFDFDGFVTAIQRLQDFWFEIAILPRREI